MLAGILAKPWCPVMLLVASCCRGRIQFATGRKTRGGSSHPDLATRGSRIELEQVVHFQRRHQQLCPSTRKEEIGERFQECGRISSAGQAAEGPRARFKDEELGKAILTSPVATVQNKRKLGERRNRLRHSRIRGQYLFTPGGSVWAASGSNARLLITVAKWQRNSARSRLWKVALREHTDQAVETYNLSFSARYNKWNRSNTASSRSSTC